MTRPVRAKRALAVLRGHARARGRVSEKDAMATWTREEARRAMPRAFQAFLGRFGRLTDLQASALPAVHSARDVVVVGPAASGKTEAALTPLCERLVTSEPRERTGAGILYVVPTRALANDTEVRVRDACAALGLRLVIRTGDRPVALGAQDRADVLVTTPESFDSLLCRWPAGFRTLRALVVDEAHLLDHSVRGDQFGILVRRLLRWEAPPARPQMVALSATIADPKTLGARLFGVEPVVVEAGAPRSMEVLFASEIRDALRELRARGLTKALVFCNARREVERVSGLVKSLGPWPPERVAVHHGSLSRREREEVERAFHWWGAGILVCTSTLEVGVDIGDVDAVVLYGAPASVEAFYQRVGRGCRRRAGMLAVCVPRDPDEVPMFESLLKDIREGTLQPEPWDPDPAVSVQQVFSILFQRRTGVERADLVDLLSPLAPAEQLERILDHLVALGFIEPGPRGRVLATSQAMDFAERGTIHSNLPDERTMEVRDASTGRPLGEVTRAVGSGEGLTLAGRTWRVVRCDRHVLYVEPIAHDPTAASRFSRRLERSPFARFLPPELREE